MRDATEEELKILGDIVVNLSKLRAAGWNTGTPPPRDRDSIVVEAGSTGVFRGRWISRAGFFVEDGGDLWPCQPLAWKEIGDA